MFMIRAVPEFSMLGYVALKTNDCLCSVCIFFSVYTRCRFYLKTKYSEISSSVSKMTLL